MSQLGTNQNIQHHMSGDCHRQHSYILKSLLPFTGRGNGSQRMGVQNMMGGGGGTNFAVTPAQYGKCSVGKSF